jgi:acetyl-CoA carboxylase carboxyltransferase component
LDPEDRPEYVKQKREDYESDIDIYRLASELIVDEMVPKDRLRAELRARLDVYESKEVDWPDKKHGVTPV